MYKLVLLRHGESKWNLENRFTGWTDVGLSKNGINEAKSSGKELKDKGYKFDLAYSSVLKRAKDTLRICFQEMGVKDINSILSWRLNERHYGSLQGLNKAETAKKYGEKQVLIWRRSFDTPPPLLNIEDKRNPKFDNAKPIYLFNLNSRYDMDGDVPGNTARLINHSCANNCDYDGKGLKIWVEAIKDIKKGEELTCDYGFGYDSDFKQFPCKCGSKNCCGFIVRAESRWRINKRFGISYKKNNRINR